MALFVVCLFVAGLALPLSLILGQSGGLPWLHTIDQNLYDDKGNQVKLCTLAIQYGASDQPITLADILKIKSMGFNAVRLHVYWQVLQPNGPDSVNTAAFTSAGDVEPAGIGLDSIVNWCAQNGLYIILNPQWSLGWVPPSWVPTASYGQTTGDSGRAVNLLDDATVQSGVDFLYNWMAQHYSANSNVIFESFNELLTPSNDDGGAPFANFNNGWVSAIEQGEGSNHHLVIVEMLWNTDWQYILSAPFVGGTHNNVILASHNYDPKNGWLGVSSVSFWGDSAWLQQKIASMADAVHAAGYPWMCTEFSKSTDQSDWQSWYTTEMSAFQSDNAVGWTFWCYCSNTLSSSGYNLNDPKTASLIMPYFSPDIALNTQTLAPTQTLSPTISSTPNISPKAPDNSPKPTLMLAVPEFSNLALIVVILAVSCAIPIILRQTTKRLTP